jgi:hypothetical protein
LVTSCLAAGNFDALPICGLAAFLNVFISFQAFKAEWEALEVTEHSWALKNSEQEMMAMLGPTNDDAHHQIQRN